MLLEDLPEKMLHRLLKSVTWTEVDRTFTRERALRRFANRVVQPSRWIVRTVSDLLHH
jgi:hypothetical protein